MTYRDYERGRSDGRRSGQARGYRDGGYPEQEDRGFEPRRGEEDYDRPELEYEMPRSARRYDAYGAQSQRDERSQSEWNAPASGGFQQERDEPRYSRYRNYPGHQNEGWNERTQWSREPQRRGSTFGGSYRSNHPEYGPRRIGRMGAGSMGTRPYYGPERIETEGPAFDSEWGASIMPRYGQHRGKGPKGYQRSDDRIREDVSEELKQDDELDASNIEVEVKHGEVTLSGEVGSRYEKRRAEDCAECAPGVTDVSNRLRVRSAGFAGDREEKMASTSGERFSSDRSSSDRSSSDRSQQQRAGSKS